MPPGVNRAMEERGVLGMGVGQFSFRADARAPLPTPGARDLACLNTHDTPTFAAFFGNGPGAAGGVGLMERAAADEELKGRRVLASRLAAWAGARGGGADAAGRVLKALLRFLARSPAAAVLVSLEDLWLETEPQDIPGTCGEHNWRRKARRTLEEITGDRGTRGARPVARGGPGRGYAADARPGCNGQEDSLSCCRTGQCGGAAMNRQEDRAGSPG